MQQSSLQTNDMPLHKFIPMETLDYIQLNQVRILYYQNPSRFYVYLRQKINTHAQFQVELQRAMQNYQSVSSPTKYQRYQPVVAQDNHRIWHRATISDIDPDATEICVYFVDVGQQENISITNIRPLPQEFIRQPAFAIPCRLYQICPRNTNDQSMWKTDDPVHDEFNKLMANNASCKVCGIQDQICYDVAVEIPKVGDLGDYLFENKLVSRITMRSAYNENQPQQQIFERMPPGLPGIVPTIQQQRLTQQTEYYNNPVQQASTRLFTGGLQKPIVQLAPSTSVSSDISSSIRTLPPQDGYYIITHVFSALEFYGHSQVRKSELEAFHKHLADIYNNNNTNDQSISVHFIMEGVPCVIQHGDNYHRVIIKHRESDSRVLVKLVDRGDELLVDTSELLQLESKYFTIPAFAQPFRLHNYDELQSTANITRKLKRLILNQRVHITQHLPMINGFYPVEMKLSDNQLVNQILLSNDNIPIIPPPVKPVEPQAPKPQQDVNIQRTNDDLPEPQKILTAPSGRSQAGRFGQNDQTSRLPQQQQQDGSRPFGQQQDESRPFGLQKQVTNGNRFNENQESSTEQNRPYNRTDEQQTNQRNGYTNNHGGDFAERGNRNFDRNNEENGPQRSGGYNNSRGGGGFADRGGRNGGFQDRNGASRNNQDEDGNENKGPPGFGSRGGFNGDRGARSGGFSGERGGRNDGFNSERGARNGGFNGDRGARNDSYQNSRDRGEGGGDFGRRGGFSDRGGFGDRGGHRGDRNDSGGRGRGGRGGGYGDRGGDNGFRSNSDNNDSTKSFSGWPNTKSTVNKFEAGDRFTENDIPKETFQFVVSHIETSNDFFIQLLSKADELSTLSDTLQKEYKEAPELNISSTKIDQACLAKSSDGCWYRAVVLKTGLTKIKVRFIDFGDTIDLDTKTVRQLAKTFCSTPPYAYRCTLQNVEANEDMNTNTIIEKCAEKNFDGKIEKKLSDNKYVLQSNNFQNLMIDINAIKSKPADLSEHIKALIAYIDFDKHQFYIQDDDETMQKITDLIHEESTTAADLPADEITLNSMVISVFDDAPYRAIVQSDINENVNIYFVDYGNTNVCLKSTLKKCSEHLKTYPHQAKRCQLDGVLVDDLDEAFKQLNDHLESDKIQISIVNQNDDLYHVRVYSDGECLNDKYRNELIILKEDDKPSTTTVKEQERPTSATGKRNNDEILSPVGSSLVTSTNIKRKKSQSETEVTPIKYLQGALTYIDKTEPFVYLQLLPESDSNLDRINALIETITEENKHNSSYQIGDNIIAQYSEDNLYYRARIESYSSSTQTYSVYFLDYGNLDENVPEDHLYSYSTELEQIESQAHKYSLENVNSQTWINIVRPLVDAKLNETIDFYFIDQVKSIIHMKFDNEHQIYNNTKPKTLTANISGTTKDSFYIHISPDANSSICEMDEVLPTHATEHKINNSWLINDLCIVFDTEQNQYFRGKILQITDETYSVQCIDYGNVINEITNDNLYLLPDDEFVKQSALARQCRLYGVNEKNQVKAIEDIIKKIDPTERVTITVENDQNDQCMFVMLFRANNVIVNDRYQSDCELETESDTDKNSAMALPISFDSAIAADDDNDTSDGDNPISTNDQYSTSPFGIPQAESTHQYGDTANATVSNSSSITVNQTIDFGENDSATSNTTLKDDTENDNLS